VEAKIEAEEELFIIAGVHLRYKMKIPAGRRAETDRALANHERYCPIRQSLARGFPITWSAELEEG